MALSYSTHLRNMIGAYCSYRRALQGGVMKIYSGSPPTNADAAATGTLLCTVSQGGIEFNPEVVSAGSVTLSGSSGSVDSITVDDVEILGVAITFTTDLTTTAALVAAQINAYTPTDGVGYYATSTGAKVIIKAVPGTGYAANGKVVAATCTTLTSTDVNMGTETAGSDGENGLQFGAVVSGIISKFGTWIGTVTSGGVAGYFRLCGSVSDDGSSTTSLVRVQGTCGTSGADYNMSNTTLVQDSTHTVDKFKLTLSLT